jgi:hypothetical protein
MTKTSCDLKHILISRFDRSSIRYREVRSLALRKLSWIHYTLPVCCPSHLRRHRPSWADVNQHSPSADRSCRQTAASESVRIRPFRLRRTLHTSFKCRPSSNLSRSHTSFTKPKLCIVVLLPYFPFHNGFQGGKFTFHVLSTSQDRPRLRSNFQPCFQDSVYLKLNRRSIVFSVGTVPNCTKHSNYTY